MATMEEDQLLHQPLQDDPCEYSPSIAPSESEVIDNDPSRGADSRLLSSPGRCDVGDGLGTELSSLPLVADGGGKADLPDDTPLAQLLPDDMPLAKLLPGARTST